MVIDTTVNFWLRFHDMVVSTKPLVRLAFSAVVSLVPMSHTHAKRCKRLRDTVGSCLALTCYNYETGEWREERAKCHLEGHLLRRVGIADERRGRGELGGAPRSAGTGELDMVPWYSYHPTASCAISGPAS